MAQLKIDEFVNDPDIDMLEGLNKEQLSALGKHLGVSVKRGQRKNEIVSIFIKSM